MTRLEKIQQHLKKHYANKVVISEDVYFRNTFHWEGSKDESKEYAGNDIEFVMKDMKLRKFEDHNYFTFCDHVSDIKELDDAKIAFIMLDEILNEEEKQVVNLKEL